MAASCPCPALGVGQIKWKNKYFMIEMHGGNLLEFKWPVEEMRHLNALYCTRYEYMYVYLQPFSKRSIFIKCTVHNLHISHCSELVQALYLRISLDLSPIIFFIGLLRILFNLI